MNEYLPILVFIIVGVIFGLIPLILGALLGPHHPNAQKSAPYECGFEPFENARLPFDIRFYRVAILFIIFDIEMVFLFPFAVTFRKLGWASLGAMGVFFALLLIGFIYEWKKGALEWE